MSFWIWKFRSWEETGDSSLTLSFSLHPNCQLQSEQELEVLSVLPHGWQPDEPVDPRPFLLVPSTRVTFLAWQYRFVIELDLSPSTGIVVRGCGETVGERMSWGEEERERLGRNEKWSQPTVVERRQSVKDWWECRQTPFQWWHCTWRYDQPEDKSPTDPSELLVSALCSGLPLLTLERSFCVLPSG